MWLLSSASQSSGKEGWACINFKRFASDTDVWLVPNKISPQTERMKRMCLQAGNLSGQLQVIEEGETETTHAFPVDQMAMNVQLTGVLIVWKG